MQRAWWDATQQSLRRGRPRRAWPRPRARSANPRLRAAILDLAAAATKTASPGAWSASRNQCYSSQIHSPTPAPPSLDLQSAAWSSTKQRDADRMDATNTHKQALMARPAARACRSILPEFTSGYTKQAQPPLRPPTSITRQSEARAVRAPGAGAHRPRDQAWTPRRPPSRPRPRPGSPRAGPHGAPARSARAAPARARPPAPGAPRAARPPPDRPSSWHQKLGSV